MMICLERNGNLRLKSIKYLMIFQYHIQYVRYTLLNRILWDVERKRTLLKVQFQPNFQKSMYYVYINWLCEKIVINIE